ncbi:MAG: hypothetical protein JSV89_05470 [Spirochaetaceae bacterium]|nr:MAG: hypothetical protein JSV89_05470 [Spirochaetaceae bacterium]
MPDTENLLIALSEFIAERKEGILSGVYEIEISNVEEGDLLQLASFGISVSGQGKFKINIDLSYKKNQESSESQGK